MNRKVNSFINSGNCWSIPVQFQFIFYLISTPSPIPGIELGIELNSHSIIVELTPALMAAYTNYRCTCFHVGLYDYLKLSSCELILLYYAGTETVLSSSSTMLQTRVKKKSLLDKKIAFGLI